MKKVKLSEIKKMVIKTIKESYITERRASSYTMEDIYLSSRTMDDYESDRYSLYENQEDEPESALRENKNTKNVNITMI